MEDPGTVVSRPGGPERSDAPPDAEELSADLATLGEIEAELGALDVALRRLDDDTYWTCEACGEAIDEAVLHEAPLSRRCPRCLSAGADRSGEGVVDPADQGP